MTRPTTDGVLAAVVVVGVPATGMSAGSAMLGLEQGAAGEQMSIDAISELQSLSLILQSWSKGRTASPTVLEAYRVQFNSLVDGESSRV